MRSIHKKTLKRFLSTLLALTMVLGMVPFTALAAPTDYVLTVDAPDKVAVNQVVDASSTLMGLPGATALTNVLVKVEMTTTVSGSHPRIIANNGIDDFNLADPDDPTHGYWGTPGGFSVNESYTDTTPLKLSFDKPGTYTAKFSLMDVSVHGVETEIVSGTKTITVVGITDLKANPTSVKVGEQFTVRAKTNLGEGTVEFDYGTQQVSVDVKPLALGGGYAECTLTAETGETTVTATLFGISGLDAVTETANITVNAADTYYDVTFMVDGLQYGEKQSVKSGENAIRPVDPLVADGKVFAGWYTDNTFATAFDFNTAIAANTTVYGKVVDKLSITFLPGAVDAYIPFSPTTVSVKSGEPYPLPTAIPTREGYTFKGWDSNGDGTADYVYNSNTNAFAPDEVSVGAADVILNAVWEQNATAPVQFNKGTAGDLILQMPTPAKYNEVVGTKFYLPAEPYCEGYTFLGWSDGSNILAAGTEQTVAAGDNIYTAAWQIKTTTVHYTDADMSDAVVFGTTTTTPVNYGSDVTFTVKVPAAYDVGSVAVLKDGALIGWTNKVETVGGSGKLEYTTLSYTFKSEGGTVAITLKSAEGVTFPVMMPTGSDFQAELAAISDGYETKGYAEVPYGGDYTFSVKAVGEFDLSSITVNGVDVMSTATVVDGVYTITVNNVTTKQLVEVKTTPKVFYTVTYILGTETFTTQRVEKGEKLLQSEMPKPTKTTGYNWDAWYLEDTMTTVAPDSETDPNVVVVNNNVTLYGKRTPWTGTVKYELVGGANIANFPNQTKTYGEALTLDTDVPTKEGYNFKGWATAANTDAVAYGKGAQFVDDTWLTEDGTAVFTLYAVWEEKTYTVSVSNGYDYTVHSLTSSVVEHNPGATDGGVYKFEVTVKSECAQFAPVVTVGTAADYDTTKANGMETPPKTEVKDSTNTYAVLKTWPVEVNDNANANDDGSVTYAYTISNITADLLVNVKVTESKDYSVEIRYWNGTMAGATIDPAGLLSFGTPATTLYSRQWVEYNHYANEPVAPVIEGYTFEGWFKADGTAFDFTAEANKIGANTTIYAKMVAITPKLSWAPASGDGWTVKFYEVTKDGSGNEAETVIGTNGAAHTYGSFIRIKLTVDVAYTVDNLSLTANGVLLGKVADPVANDADSDGKPESYTYTFEIPSLEEDTLVKILGIERKTVTVTYNANARDDVSGMPEQHEVVYYINGKTNSTISALVPVRTGYKFLGWNTDPAATTPTHAAGAIADFTTDTTLYAIWEAKEVTVELTFSDILGATGEWEKDDDLTETFNLVATFNQPVVGDVIFKKNAIDSTAEVIVGSVSINGGTSVTLNGVEAGSFKNTSPFNEKYWVEFKANADEGYKNAISAKVDLRINSRALSWQFVADGNKLTIYKGNTTTGTPVSSMTAGQTYTLKLPEVVALNAATYLGNVVAGTQYKVKWQYRETAKSDWVTIQNDGGDTYLVTSDYSGYAFRALVEPLNAPFTKAATYVNNTVTAYGSCLIDDVYARCLETLPTADTERQATTTTLAITGADNEAADVKINGATPFSAAHLAQFEGQTVTLKATVTDTTTSEGVLSGYVKFYRYVDGINDVLLNTTQVAVDEHGIATFEVTIADYNTAGTALTNVDKFYAVYEENATYATSSSVANPAPDEVYIKSTAIKTPVIDSEKPGKLNDSASTTSNSTTYKYNLTDLLAGVKHTFTLRTGNTDADYSVVALDGRTVPADNYTIEWLVKSQGESNEVKLDADNKQTTYTVDESQFGDSYRVKLTGTGVFAGSEAYSMKAVIDAKQDVSVTVTTNPDKQYQLNVVDLFAKVEGADSVPNMKPTGTVQFYYTVGAMPAVSDATYTYLGEAKLAEDTKGNMIATIPTKALPVKDDKFTWQDVTITAIYLGDETFKASGTFDETAETIADIGTVTDAEVRVFSSVIYSNANYANKAADIDIANITDNRGMVIWATGDSTKAGDAMKSHETQITLNLGAIYTLDHADDAHAGEFNALALGTDYTVEWQVLRNASVYSSDYATAPWVKIADSEGKDVIKVNVEQGAAYRAKISALPAEADKAHKVAGSYLDDIQNANAVMYYYTNVLVASQAQATVTVHSYTSGRTGTDDQGLVQGEKLYIDVYASGTVGATPVGEVTVEIFKTGVAESVATLGEDNTFNGHTNTYEWDTTGATPGYYYMVVDYNFQNNDYGFGSVIREFVVRSKNHSISATDQTVTYDGQVKAVDVSIAGMCEDFAAQAQKSWTVKYYDKDDNLVEPIQAGTYTAKITLPADTGWTKKTAEVTLTIAPRAVKVVDLVAQAKVYDKGNKSVNIQEIVLNKAETNNDTDGLPTGDTGVISGDSVFATGTVETATDAAGNTTLVIKSLDELQGPDAKNYVWADDAAAYNTESFTIQRNQVRGDIAGGNTMADALILAYQNGAKFDFPKDKIFLYDQQGREITDYTISVYYHSGDGVTLAKDGKLQYMGKYTIIARPEQDNYKGGATQVVYVGETAQDADVDTTINSVTIDITNTVKVYDGQAASAKATDSRGADATVTYWDGGNWVPSVTNAGRYTVKATATTGDVAYGIYTIVKALPDFDVTVDAATLTYTSEFWAGILNAKPTYEGGADTGYYTYAGDVVAGDTYDFTNEVFAGVSYEKPIDVGTYVVTYHAPETDNYVAHEESATFTITPAPLTVTAESVYRKQYGSFPDVLALYSGLVGAAAMPDTSLRDVQVAPDMMINMGDTDLVGNSSVGQFVIDTVENSALAKNYDITYVDGTVTTNATDPQEELRIRGMINNGEGATNVAYVDDVIQLYAYGNRKGTVKDSSVLTWKITKGATYAEIDNTGKLTVKAATNPSDPTDVVEVTLIRGSESDPEAIRTTLTFVVKKIELKVSVPTVDRVYAGAPQDYDGTPVAYDRTFKKILPVDVTLETPDNISRTVIGGQIVTNKVAAVDDKYQSLVYGGEFSINDKYITVNPVAGEKIYGANTYTIAPDYAEVTPVGGVPALKFDAKVTAVTDDYNNLDVGTYEILVTGDENMNYNVTYTTAAAAATAKVTAKNLTFKTGVINSDGRTSGYMKSNSLFYKDEGFAITGETFTTTPVDRMYGEVNPVMDYLFDALIAGDSEADLVSMLDWLVEYSDVVKHNIQGDANVKFDKDHHIGGYRSSDYLAGMSPYYIDGMLAADGVKNYTTTVTEATQNIYQRPVTLTPRVTLTAYKPSIIDGSNNVKQDVLLQLLLNNLVVGEYNGKGGLATLLGHTIEDLNIQIVTATYNGTDKIDVTIKLGNTNYWTNTTTFTVNVDPSKIVATYGPLGWTSASVTMIGVDESGNTTGPVNVTGTVTYLIYAKDTTVTEHKYSHYKNLTPVRSVTMTSGGSTGYYIANYGRLSAGDYVMFAIAEGYTIIE